MLSYACRPPFTECVLVSFLWAGERQKLYVLREKGAETKSGAFVARHLGVLTVATFTSHSQKNRGDRWTRFALTLQRQSGGEDRWLAKQAEVELLMQHGVIKTAPGHLSPRLLQVEVRASPHSHHFKSLLVSHVTCLKDWLVAYIYLSG